MKLIFSKERVIAGLQRAVSVMPTKTGAACLRALWIRAKDGSVTFTATDANVEFTGTYPAEVLEEGLIGVNGQIFFGLISTCHNDIKLVHSENEGSLHILHSNGTCKLPVMETNWYQEMKPFPEGNSIIFSGDMLREAIDKVSYGILDEASSNTYLNCLYINKRDKNIDICGLNGHLFTLFSIEHDNFSKIIPSEGLLIQKNYLSQISRWLSKEEIEFSFTDKQIFFRNSTSDREVLSVPRSISSFPNYFFFLEKVEHEGKNTILLNKNELKDALNRMLTVNTDVENCTDFSISEDGKYINCYAQSENSGEVIEKIYIKSESAVKHITFKTKELMSVLDHFHSKDIRFNITDEVGPCGIDGNGDQFYTVIIMPIQTVENTYDEVVEE